MTRVRRFGLVGGHRSKIRPWRQVSTSKTVSIPTPSKVHKIAFLSLPDLRRIVIRHFEKTQNYICLGPQAPGLVPLDSTCDLLHNGGVERSVAPLAAHISPETGFVANLELSIVFVGIKPDRMLIQAICIALS